MTFVNKRTRVFSEGSAPAVTLTRSEARMKRYNSAMDLRTWGDVVEERRQEILEHTAKNRGGKPRFCIENIVPLDVLLNTVMGNKNQELGDLEKEVDLLEKKVGLYDRIGLTPEQTEELQRLMEENNLDAYYSESDSELD